MDIISYSLANQAKSKAEKVGNDLQNVSIEMEKTGLSFADVSNLTVSFADPGGITLNWKNVDSLSYIGREVYVSAEDITNIDREFAKNNALLVSNSIGTGNNTDDSYNESSVEAETTYYFKIFSVYEIAGVKKYSNGVSISYTTPKISGYGVEWNKNLDIVTRTELSTGKTRSFFDTIAPWSEIRRCNVANNGVVSAYYGDPTYAVNGSNGQVMVEIPKFYYKFDVTGDGYKWSISSYEKTGYAVHPAFFRDRDGDGVAEEVNFRYIAAYQAVVHNGTSYINGDTSTTDNASKITASWKLASVSGYKPYGSLTRGNFRMLAGRIGNGWGIFDFNLLFAIQLLYLVEYADLDSQKVMGNGYVKTTNTSQITNGYTDTLGNTSGNAGPDGTYNAGTDLLGAVSYRGIENIYGNMQHFVDGVTAYGSGTSGVDPITIKIGNVNFTDLGNEYEPIYTSEFVYTNTGAGYVSDIFPDARLGFLPSQANASSSTKFHDAGGLDHGMPGTTFGGTYIASMSAGMFSLTQRGTAPSRNNNFGTRLAF